MANTRSRRLLMALGIYAIVVGVYFALVPRFRIVEHTSFNHFALLAESWLKRRLDLGGGPPAYAQNNDFASYGGKWFVAFPPFPAVLLVPFLIWGKTAENVRDGQFFLWLAGVGPAVLFLALEKLRRIGASERTAATNAALSLLFAFGTVYFFTALQGTVWFAAHVVGVALAALYLLFALEAEHPMLAGLVIGLAFMTRPPLLYAIPLFVFEAVRVSLREPSASAEVPKTRFRRLIDGFRRLDKLNLLRLGVWFAVPLVLCIGVTLWHNKARFGHPLEFGYQYLTVAWQARMKRWGLFNYHYLGRNLGVVVGGLPWFDPKGKVPVVVNMHGLALWITTPLYLWLIWPKRSGPVVIALYVTAAAVAIPGLFYQNTGWMQFGYRFSNDYAIFLFALLAVTTRRYSALFGAAAAWSIAVNAFGAVTFDRGDMKKFYYEDASQKILYQPD